MHFWNSLAFSMIQQMLVVWLCLSKTSLNIREFTIHVLLKPGLENFELSRNDFNNLLITLVLQFCWKSQLEMFCLLKGWGYPFIRERNFLNKDSSISDCLCLVLEVWSQWDNIFNTIWDGYGVSQVALVVKNPPANADVREVGSIPRSGRSPGGGHGNPLQYSCLENRMDRGA